MQDFSLSSGILQGDKHHRRHGMKALFFDLDGTLLDSSKKIPASAAEALMAARAKGVKV